MSILNELVSQIEDTNLRTRIAQEVEKLAKQKKFGLVFEEHLPESTPLYDMPIKIGSRVAKRDVKITDVYNVISINDGIAKCINKETKETTDFPVDDLVVVAEFGEPIYPYLKPLDSVCNAPDNDLWHTLIEADNYHALQLLEYLYAGKVDCIYIDPPYNTGAKDWKYNNDYVDDLDQYRHSKWLSMMKKRLEIAKKLLNPRNSVLIVTIDDKEYLHLGCLLEELFSGAKMTMISSVINPAGKAKKGGVDFSRTDEYIYFLQLGNCPVLPETREVIETPIAWESFRRHSLANGRGKHGVGACGPNQFYPFYINNQTHEIVKIGEAIHESVDRFSVEQIEGCSTVFPVRDNGIEMNWGAVRETAIELWSKGYLRVGNYYPDKPQQYNIVYLTKGTIKSIENGEVVITKVDEKGVVDGYFPEGKPKVPTTNWNKTSHNATSHGTDIINKILCDARFDYPKSLYAVRDCLNLFLAENKNALIMDFFAGSGTTLHAVNLLNAVDNGNRRCIIVTNNEVSTAEAAMLEKKGIKRGDTAWNELGIARYVTWPRIKCSILGVDVKGNKLNGTYGVETDSYILNDEIVLISKDTKKEIKTKAYKKVKIQLYPELSNMYLSEGFKANVNFFQLGFLDKNAVALGRQFKELLPVLWMKSGAKGECPSIDGDLPDYLILEKNKFAVLINEQAYLEFVEELDKNSGIETIFIVTDSEAGYRSMIANINVENTYQLYRDYLDNFRINSVRR